jgi:hypothetical protein
MIRAPGRTLAEINTAHRDALSRLRERRVLQAVSPAEYGAARRRIDYQRACDLEALLVVNPMTTDLSRSQRLPAVDADLLACRRLIGAIFLVSRNPACPEASRTDSHRLRAACTL